MGVGEVLATGVEAVERAATVAEDEFTDADVQDDDGRYIDESPRPDEDIAASPVTMTEPALAWLGLEEAFRHHYYDLCRLARMLVRSTVEAEDVVTEVFTDTTIPGRLRDPDKLLAYLKQAVVNRSRSVIRHRHVEAKHAAKMIHGGAWDVTAERGIEGIEQLSVVDAISKLPNRQREAVVLRYYADLSEAEVAAAMKISPGTVKSHTARGMAALREALQQVVFEID